MNGPLAGAGAPTVRAFGISDRGLVRETNEDAFAVADLRTGARSAQPVAWSAAPPGVLLAVSDGMGGALAGDVASALSVEGVVRGMLDKARAGRSDGEALRRVIEDASRTVHEEAKSPERRGMGATFTAVLVTDRTAFVAQIGDSRAYLLRGGGIGQITHDQSYVQMLVDAGVMSPAEASHSPRKNIVLQVMGQEAVRVALGRIDLALGDRLLVCSDGLTNVVDDARILATVAAPSDLTRACTDLVLRTKEGGAPDNVTVVLAAIG